MLVLTRKVGERIHIGDDITLVVTKSAGNRVTLGIEAPKDVRIIRGELERYVNQFNDDAEAATDVADDECPVSAPAVGFPGSVADACTFVPMQAR